MKNKTENRRREIKSTTNSLKVISHFHFVTNVTSECIEKLQNLKKKVMFKLQIKSEYIWRGCESTRLTQRGLMCHTRRKNVLFAFSNHKLLLLNRKQKY